MAENHTDSRPTIGLLLGGITDLVSQTMWVGADDAAQERGANLLCFAGEALQAPEESLAQANALYDLVGAESVDGLVIWGGGLGQFISPEEVQAFCEQYRPLPMVNAALPLEGIPTILVDNYAGMREAVLHLVEVHGYRRIAFIRGPEGHPEAEDRYRAYADVLAEHGLSLDPALVAPGVFDESSGVEAVNLLLDERKVDFEAIVAVDDATAIGAMEALQARGVQVPDDIAVVGFDDTEEGQHITPSLTSVQALVYEQGRQAMEMVLALLAGETVPDQVRLPTRVVIRRSCGCASAAVAQAVAGTPARGSEAPEVALPAQRGRILSAMRQALGASNGGAASEGVERFLDAFIDEVKGESPSAFLSALEEVLRQVVTTHSDLSPWQGALSTLRCLALPCLDDAALARAEDLWQQARVLIGEIAQQAQAHRRLQMEQQVQILNEVSQSLTTTFSMTELMNAVVEELPRLGVRRAYISLYERPERPLEWSRLATAYDEKGRIELEASEQRFPSRQLAPDGLLFRDGRHSMLVQSLGFGSEQPGFVVFEVSLRERAIYEMLRGQISSTLHGVLLAQQVEERSRALQEANYALQRRAIQIEASAEVGRAITSIFDINELLRQTAKLISDRFGFYHVGIFLVDVMGEWAVLREATGEAGAQMKAEGHRLAVGDTSMVGWTAAHGQPRIALDVGEDAVRFSHPRLPYTRSEMTLPLTVGDTLLGVLNVQSTEESAFDQDDVRTLRAMADQIAVAIQNARRIADEGALLEATSPVYRTSRLLTTATTRTEVADAIIASVGETEADGCIVVEFEFSPAGEPEALLYLGVWRRDREPQFQVGLRLPVDESPFPLEMVSTLWMVPDVDQDERLPRSALVVFQSTGAKALVNIPLRSGERVIGQVVVIRATPGPFSEAALRLYEVLSDQAAVALERAELLEEAQQRAGREQQARQMIDRIRRVADLEQALEMAAEELARAMEVPHVSIDLGIDVIQ